MYSTWYLVRSWVILLNCYIKLKRTQRFIIFMHLSKVNYHLSNTQAWVRNNTSFHITTTSDKGTSETVPKSLFSISFWWGCLQLHCLLPSKVLIFLSCIDMHFQESQYQKLPLISKSMRVQTNNNILGCISLNKICLWRCNLQQFTK